MSIGRILDETGGNEAKEGDHDKDGPKDQEGGEGKFEYVTGDQKGPSQVFIPYAARRARCRFFGMHFVAYNYDTVLDNVVISLSL